MPDENKQYIERIRGYLDELRAGIAAGNVETKPLPVESQWVSGPTKSGKKGVLIAEDATFGIMMTNGASGYYFCMNSEGEIMRQQFKQGSDGQYLGPREAIDDDAFLQHIAKCKGGHSPFAKNWANPEDVCGNLEGILGKEEGE
jgi:hypothetical protein